MCSQVERSVAYLAELQVISMDGLQYIIEGEYIEMRIEMRIDCENNLWKDLENYVKRFKVHFEGSGNPLKAVNQESFVIRELFRKVPLSCRENSVETYKYKGRGEWLGRS